MKFERKLAEALANLRGNRDFAVVLEGMAEHRAEEVQRCIDSEGPVQLRASGAVKAIDWWTKAFADAPTILEKLNQRQKTQ